MHLNVYKWDGLLWEGCHQVQHMHHNANNLPLWTWWQQYQITLPLWHQGQRADQDNLFLCCPYSPWIPVEISEWAPPLYMPWCTNLSMLFLRTCWNLCSAEICLFMLPLTVSKVCKKMFYKKNMTLYIINDLPITKDSYIHPSPNQVGIDSSIQPSGDTPKVYTRYNKNITLSIPGIVGKSK